MKVSIIIVNYNTRVVLKKCLVSITGKKWLNKFDIWVVDNASDDGSAQMVVEDFPRINLIKSRSNLGFAGGNNLALKKVTSENIILLNSDTEVLERSIDELVNFMNRGRYGIVSCKLLNGDGSLQPNSGDLPGLIALIAWLSGIDDLPWIGKYLPTLHQTSSEYYRSEKEVGWVSGSVMGVKKEVLEKVGLLDEKIFMYGEDVELCLRATKAGYKVGWTDTAQIVHLGGGSSSDPHFSQWLGEFKGLVYMYKKNYNELVAFIIKMLIYPFILLRVLAFLVIGKIEYSKTYAKILFTF